mmetsp:Transcript_4526/g.7710  ORF Transcript_4526/g.7710 Transcript_4526/m.7710 type:complete len:159 (+) Transcript_4526:1349-1825(+)
MIGGFGNITKGEMDFWSLDDHKEIGASKSPCATRVSWSPCGRYLMTCILNERLKVNNGVQIFRANGTKIFEKPYEFKELYSADWQPIDSGLFSKPELSQLKKTEVQSQSTKPKRIFKFGKGSDSSAFQQQMREQMQSGSGAGDKGPKRVDANQYKQVQ